MRRASLAVALLAACARSPSSAPPRAGQASPAISVEPKREPDRACSSSVDVDSTDTGAATFRDPAAILSVVRASIPRLRACLEAWRADHPGGDPLEHLSDAGKGWPRMKFVIGADGTVSQAATRCMPDPVRACEEAVLRTLVFPAAEGSTTVVFP